MSKYTHDRQPDHLMHAESLLHQRVRILYSGILFSITISAALALILIIVQQPLIPLTTSLNWYGVLVAVLIARLLLFVNWRHADTKTESAQKRWLLYFRISILATGIVWGVGGLIMMPAGDLSHQIFVSFAMAGLIAGGMMTLSADRESVIAFVLPAMSPHLVFLFLQEETVSQGKFAMLLLFMFFVFLSARKSGETLLENAKLRLHAVESESRLRMMLDYSPIAARITDSTDQKIVFANQSYADLLEVQLDSVIGLAPSEYYADEAEYDAIVKRVKHGERISNQLVELTFEGSPQKIRWVLASYSQIEYQGKTMILGWFYDITDRKLMEEQVQHLAYHDPLTDLPNRMLFHDRMQQAMTMADRHQHPLALLFIDLDKFKPVNDNFGHDVGDEVLRESAKRIRACLRKPDSVARFGGDEFVVLLHEVRNEQDALSVAQKIRESLERPFTIEDRFIQIGASIGVALYPSSSTNEDGLLSCADIAMYDAKKSGRHTVKLYDASMAETPDSDL